MREKEAEIGQLVPTLVANPMGRRPAVRKEPPDSGKGLWVWFKVAFWDDDGTSETSPWQEVILEGVRHLSDLNGEPLERLQAALVTEAVSVDREAYRLRIDDAEFSLLHKAQGQIAHAGPVAQRKVIGNLMTKASTEELEAELQRRKAAKAAPPSKKRKKQ